MPVRVMLVDDHVIVRDGLQMIINTQRDMKVVVGVSDGLSAVEAAEALRPDVVVMDISMPGMNGIEAARNLLALMPHVKIIILTMYESPEYVIQAFKSGVSGFLLKKSAGIEIIKAIREVATGHRYFGRGVEDLWSNDMLEDVDPYETLSRREKQILKLVVGGKTSKEIAEMIFISAKSVETYRSRLMRKLGIDNIAGLVKYALRRGLTNSIE
ncbi:MAG TPA: response regulator transcription factor [Geobacteraceae bacterium]|nr:response regulator transcription factor [Geobacteraceae bacterium]